MKKAKRGFTLVELLIAISIFAVLSALGWKIFDHISQVKERNIARENNLAKLQNAYQIALRDSVQIIPVTASVNDNIQPALILENGKLIFSKSGVIDPLLQGKPSFERVEYLYDEDAKTIIRLRYSNINRSSNENPERSVILDNIEDFQISALDPNELDTWPSNVETNESEENVRKRLPKGLKFTFSQNGVKYEWIFSLLNTDNLFPKTTT